MRYVRVLWSYLAYSVQLDLEYRVDFLISSITALLSLGTGLVVLHVMFSHAQAFGDWSFPEAVTLFGIFLVFQEFIAGILTQNLNRLPELIRRGDLDFVLLKPINSQFQISVRRFPLTSIPSIALGSLVSLYGMNVAGTLGLGNIALAACLIFSGVVIVYSIWVILLTTAFWWVMVENITEIFNSLFSTARFPVTAFPSWVRVFLTFVIPIAFITTVPAAAAVGRLSWGMAAASIAIAALLLLMSHAFWRIALSSYTSASS